MRQPLDTGAIADRWRASSPGAWTASARSSAPEHAKDFRVHCGAAVTLTGEDGRNIEADTTFAAAAHQDIPALLEEVSKLRYVADFALRTFREEGGLTPKTLSHYSEMRMRVEGELSEALGFGPEGKQA